MTAITHSSATPATGFARWIGLAGHLTGLVQMLCLWRERAQERRALAAMDSRQLKDIGLSNVDAWREANKPLWRP